MQQLPSRSWSAGSLMLGSRHMAEVEGKRSKANMEAELQELQKQLAEEKAKLASADAGAPEPTQLDQDLEETQPAEEQLKTVAQKKNLAAEILELERLEARKDHLLNARDGRETPNSGTTPGSRSVRSRQFTPPPSRARSTRSEPASDADGDEDQDEKIGRDAKGRVTINGKAISDAAIEQRLRRFCAVKKNGYVKSGSEVKKLFEDLDKRQDLVQMFKDSLLDKEELKKRVHHKVTKEQEKKVTVKCGWYTEKQMKEILKMSKPEIDSVVAYTAQRPKLRKDWKYDSKVKKHYVEVDEEGCLTKTYRQSDEWSESGEYKTSKKRRKLTTGPMTADNGDSDVDEGSEPDIQPEKQDRGELMTKTMESLLVRSAKMRDLCTKVEATGKADQSLVDELKSIQKNMDKHYDHVAASLARFKNTSQPSEKLLEEIQEKLEVAEILGSKATRAEAHSQPFLRASRNKPREDEGDANDSPPAPGPQTKPKAKSKAKPAKAKKRPSKK